jgi:DNA excision repair protein ERCC-2
MTEFAVSVRDLVAFCYRRGDIDHRYTPSPSAEQGTEGHQRVYRRRPQSYEPEFTVNHVHQEQGVTLRLRGRADGFDPVQGLVEEIKTCRVDPASIPEAVHQLHLAQGRVYAALIAAQEDLESLEVRLCWFNIDTDQEHHICQIYQRSELQVFLTETLARFSDWLTLLARLRQDRQQSLSDLGFPHGEFRPGQREIAELVYKCVDQGGQLMVEAPTGIGKTAAVMYPALKALAGAKHEAMVFVTSRTVGRRAAEDSLALMVEEGLQACSLSLTAKDSICFSPGKACHGDDCPYALGYYDRLAQAMAEAVQQGVLRREQVEAIARHHQVCPYQLTVDLRPWVDILIADAHYVFSLSAGVGSLMEQDQRRWTVLLDEAHNLPDRARSMYSARLTKAELMKVKKISSTGVKRSLDRVNRTMLELQKEDWPEQDVRHSLPVSLVNALGDFVAAMGEVMASDIRFAPSNPQVMSFYFAVLQWLRVAEQWGDEYCLELQRGEGSQGLSLGLNCLDPSRLLGLSHDRGHALVAFSATLSPQDWMGQLLGLGDDAVYRRLSSPFAEDQLDVLLDTGIDTRFRQRELSAPLLVSRIQTFLNEEQGNCILYFPSYHYLRNILDRLRSQTGGLPDRRIWEQRPAQGEVDRNSLFEALEEHRNVAAFCILGGAFSEGVDLPGDLLSSVVIVGVGLPQLGPEREQLRQWYQQAYGQGFEYAYLYPAMQKVDQALGRVVRSDSDRGRALLIDARYGWPQYRDLLPPWWSYREKPSSPG